MKLSKLAHYGDLLAIPFFIISVLYFYQIENKSLLEMGIMVFLLIALLFDTFCSILFLSTKKS